MRGFDPDEIRLHAELKNITRKYKYKTILQLLWERDYSEPVIAMEKVASMVIKYTTIEPPMAS